jgi:hypothetical protein
MAHPRRHPCRAQGSLREPQRPPTGGHQQDIGLVDVVIAKRTYCAYIVLLKMTISHDLLRLKLAESRAGESPALTRRDARLPRVPGKAFAVVAVRRGGKSSFLAQCRADRLAAGRPREGQFLISLEDERLAGLSVARASASRVLLIRVFDLKAIGCRRSVELQIG